MLQNSDFFDETFFKILIALSLSDSYLFNNSLNKYNTPPIPTNNKKYIKQILSIRICKCRNYILLLDITQLVIIKITMLNDITIKANIYLEFPYYYLMLSYI